MLSVMLGGLKQNRTRPPLHKWFTRILSMAHVYPSSVVKTDQRDVVKRKRLRGGALSALEGDCLRLTYLGPGPQFSWGVQLRALMRFEVVSRTSKLPQEELSTKSTTPRYILVGGWVGVGETTLNVETPRSTLTTHFPASRLAPLFFPRLLGTAVEVKSCSKSRRISIYARVGPTPERMLTPFRQNLPLISPAMNRTRVLQFAEPSSIQRRATNSNAALAHKSKAHLWLHPVVQSSQGSTCLGCFLLPC